MTSNETPSEDHIEVLDTFSDAIKGIVYSVEPEDEEAKENTGDRAFRMMHGLLSGYTDKVDIKDFDFVKSNDLVVVRDIPFFSLCKHHILPFFGQAHVGYLPNEKVIGLSKIPRIVKIYSHRLQIQERIGRQVCDALMNSPLEPKGVIVVLDAQHMCMQMRGIESIGSVTTTASLAGEFENNSELKREFYHLIKR